MTYLSFLFTGVTGVRINSLTVPQIIKNGTDESVILDCDYSVDETEKKGLVVKWFHERKQSPVYQWIPNQKPIDLGILKGKLNLDFRADSDEFKLHRALQIIRPTIELSGKLQKNNHVFSLSLFTYFTIKLKSVNKINVFFFCF